MNNLIEYVHIQNFKSIRDLKLEDCRRINLFIGYPNVGKSNVIEALSLFSVPYLNINESLNKLVRVENRNELFYDLQKQCRVETNIVGVDLEKESSALLLLFYTAISLFNDGMVAIFERDLNLRSGIEKNKIRSFNIKRYTFVQNNEWKSIDENLLLPPFGENIIDTLSYNNNVAEVKIWMKKEFAKFGFEYILDKSSNSLKIQQRLGNDEVFQLPYSSIADTIQRVIFHKTAIASNKDSVLLFEEPEAHAFPPYIKTITQDIIDSKSNQFFIVTHSPLIVNSFLEYEHVRKNLAIYLFDFEDRQTVVKRLTDEDLDEIYNCGEDLFFNLEKFL